MSSGTARVKAQMEPTKRAAIEAAKTSLLRELGSGKRVTGSGIKVEAEVKTVGGIKYWYATAECNWKDR